MSDSRRSFLRKLGTLMAGGMATGVMLDGCAASGAPAYRYTPAGNIIDLYLNWYPELYKTGGVVELILDGMDTSILVVRTAIDRFAAVSPLCTYGECKVAIKENLFVCPCHSCRYGLDGTPVKGPAERPLTAYRTEYRETSLRIFLS